MGIARILVIQYTTITTILVIVVGTYEEVLIAVTIKVGKSRVQENRENSGRQVCRERPLRRRCVRCFRRCALVFTKLQLLLLAIIIPILHTNNVKVTVTIDVYEGFVADLVGRY